MFQEEPHVVRSRFLHSEIRFQRYSNLFRLIEQIPTPARYFVWGAYECTPSNYSGTGWDRGQRDIRNIHSALCLAYITLSLGTFHPVIEADR